MPSYFLLQHWLRPTDEKDIRLFTVTRRSFPITIEETGELKATSSVDVQNEVEGRTTIISLVEEGIHVNKGDLLVELASDEIDEKIRDLEIKESVSDAAHEAAQKELEILRDGNRSNERKALLALEMAEIELKKYQEGESFELVQDAQLALDQAKREHKRAQDYLKDSEDLFKQGFITQIERDDDAFAEYKAQNELKKAQVSLDVLKQYTVPMNLKKQTSDVEEAKAELERTKKAAKASEEKSAADVKAKKDELAIVRDKLAKAREQKEKTRIHAPADGLVVYWKEGWWEDESRIKTGAQVHERQILVELPDTSSMKVLIRVHEAQIEKLAAGLSATIAVEGVAGREFTGKVIKIAALADSEHRWINPDLKQYQTEVLIEGDVTGLKPGATAKVELKVIELNDVLAVPVQSVFGKGDKYYVFVTTNRQCEPVEVKIGMASNEYVEIVKGLDEGQQIRLAITEDLRLMLPDVEDADDKGASKGETKSSTTRQSPTSQPTTRESS